jgi:class 3 adenylate cyclase
MSELNCFFGQIVPIIDRCGGWVVGYRGDGLLAAFGAPYYLETPARAAVAPAIGITRAVRSAAPARADPALPPRTAMGPNRTTDGRNPTAPVQIGCGINTGRIVAGNLG